MFIGHYAVSFAARAVQPALPLWMLFLAVQLVDIFWAAFVLFGVEKVRIVPGITATNPLDLYYMPYTHSLAASLAWALAALLMARLVPGIRKRGTAFLLGITVLSHWLLDLLVHRPDLPLYDNEHKLGLGLWNYPATAFTLEILLLAGGMLWYARTTSALSRRRVYGLLLFGVLMALVQARVFFGAPPASDKEVAITALFAYFVFAAIAYWLDRKPAKQATGSSGQIEAY